METLQRSLVKTIVWRIVATLITFMTVFAFTGALNKSTVITITAAAFLAVGYYFNERIWDKIHWGRRKPAAITQNESFESDE
ncbi:MAG: hypothetical protein G01um101456_591 [Parcubacteria group bacterium Gr01-1014_56]|nr:MAG: hypothetical protein G01um101456_591 [Parcubacteria group bacterium Gr01-1014_56]